MLQATRTFITQLDGAEVRIFRDRSRVAEDHELARRYPDAFQPAPDRPNGSRERLSSAGGTATVARTTTPAPLPRTDFGREHWRVLASAPECSIGNRSSGVRVRLAADARREMLAIFQQTRRDGLEIGLLAFGHEHRGLVEVLRVVGPGPAAVRRVDSFTFDLAHCAEVIDSMDRAGLALVGDAHSHPSGYLAPSRTDLASSARLRSGLGLGHYLSMIATNHGGDGWHLSPWIVTAGRKRDHCAPATIF